MNKQEILDKCNELAVTYYRNAGFEVPYTYKMYEATHPQEVAFWDMAVEACEVILDAYVPLILEELNYAKRCLTKVGKLC